jgi:hypothetical protein
VALAAIQKEKKILLLHIIVSLPTAPPRSRASPLPLREHRFLPFSLRWWRTASTSTHHRHQLDAMLSVVSHLKFLCGSCHFFIHPLLGEIDLIYVGHLCSWFLCAYHSTQTVSSSAPSHGRSSSWLAHVRFRQHCKR